jgi:hypothetical protein
LILTFSGQVTNAGKGLNVVPATYWLINRSISGSRLHFGATLQDKELTPWVEIGQQVVFDWAGPLVLVAPFGLAEVALWRSFGSASFGPKIELGTTFKGGPRTVLGREPAKLLGMVAGEDSLVLAQDQDNHPDARVWISTHVEPGVEKRFPLLPGRYLEIPRFNASLYAWHTSPPHVQSEVAIFFIKHAVGIW